MCNKAHLDRRSTACTSPTASSTRRPRSRPAVVAAGALAVCPARARRELDDRVAPLAGLVAVFVFAAQMVTFPVGAGTSGHLLGGGPGCRARRSADCDGVPHGRRRRAGAPLRRRGVSALGTNVLLLAVVGPWVGYAVGAPGWSCPSRLGVGAGGRRDRRRWRRSSWRRSSSSACTPWGSRTGPLVRPRRSDGHLAPRHRSRGGGHHLPRRLDPRGRPARPRPRGSAGAPRPPNPRRHPGGAAMTRRPSTRTAACSSSVPSVSLCSSWPPVGRRRPRRPDGLQLVAQTLGFADSERVRHLGVARWPATPAPLGTAASPGGLAGVLGGGRRRARHGRPPRVAAPAPVLRRGEVTWAPATPPTSTSTAPRSCTACLPTRSSSVSCASSSPSSRSRRGGARWPLGALLALPALLAFTGVRARHLAPRLVVALPVVVFAVALPFVASGPDSASDRSP